jgi:CheY-like chemotaxis protein
MMSVLLVEDDIAIRSTLIEIFEQAGLDVMEASDADDALAILQNPSRQIDVLVTDLDLGPGDDGLMLAVRARLGQPLLHVIYATGSPERLDDHQFLPRETLFSKPFCAADLTNTVCALSGADAARHRVPVAG